MILKEQTISNNRIYYHGERPGVSLKKKLEPSEKFGNCIWLTTDPVYSVAYARNRTFDPEKRKQYGYIYECILRKGLNIFSPRYKPDQLWLRKQLDPDEEEDISYIEYIDWGNTNMPYRRDRIIDIIRKKYDGFMNYEVAYKKDDEDSYPSFGIFDSDNVKIIKTWDGNDFVKKNEKVKTTLQNIRSGKDHKRIILESLSHFQEYGDLNYQKLYENLRFFDAAETANCVYLVEQKEVRDYYNNLLLLKERFEITL